MRVRIRRFGRLSYRPAKSRNAERVEIGVGQREDERQAVRQSRRAMSAARCSSGEILAHSPFPQFSDAPNRASAACRSQTAACAGATYPAVPASEAFRSYRNSRSSHEDALAAIIPPSGLKARLLMVKRQLPFYLREQLSTLHIDSLQIGILFVPEQRHCQPPPSLTCSGIV